MTWRAIVCGGRGYSNQVYLNLVLDRFHSVRPLTLVMHGGATGADALAGQWARDRGVPEQAFPADWKLHGHAAGPIRNKAMAVAGAELVIAFPGGKGTRSMINIAKKYGIPYYTQTAAQYG